jgi:alpha-L-rhamnosidase
VTDYSGTELLGALQVGALQVEHQVDPLGVDVAKPRLSWVLSSEHRNRLAQKAYQIRGRLAAPGAGR